MLFSSLLQISLLSVTIVSLHILAYAYYPSKTPSSLLTPTLKDSGTSDLELLPFVSLQPYKSPYIS